MEVALAKRVEQTFEEAMKRCGTLREEIMRKLDGCTGDLKLYLQYLYGAMPLSDCADYPFELYRAYAEHALRLRAESTWEIPEELFLAYVLHYRINNEAIEDCRSQFYDWLHDRTAGMTMEQAALEVNYWSQERVIYQATDGRTATPLTVLRRTFGRCGEESTFTVTALRSIGLPARQVYAPRWAHCDDNHAWVEVWCDGKWRYMGACEPEETLDKGWFNAASSRAMVIHSRLLSNLTAGEPAFGRDGKAYVLNQVDRYNPQTRELVIHCGEAGIEVRCEVLNYAEFSPVAVLRSGADGIARVRLGFGGVHLHAVRGGCIASMVVDTNTTGEVTLDFSHPEHAFQEWSIVAPKDNLRPAPALTAEQQATQKKRFANGLATRGATVASFPQEPDLVRNAMGNHAEVSRFLDAGGLRERLLRTLTEKDLADCKAEILEDHVRGAQAFADRYPQDIFDAYLLCPRISLERLTAYRSVIMSYFDAPTREKFTKEPSMIWEWAGEIREEADLEYSTLITTPEGMLRIQSGSLLSKRVLFVAICRTLGIPARLHPATQHAEYYQDGSFHDMEYSKQVSVQLTLTSTSEEDWIYAQNWSLAKLESGVYQTLSMRGCTWDGNQVKLDLYPGHYRILTCNRMPNGGVVANQYCMDLEADQTLAIEPPKADIMGMLNRIPLTEFTLRTANDQEVSAHALAAGHQNLLIWLAEGEEPTEHILNEMIERSDRFNRSTGQIIFLVRNQKALANATLAHTLELIPKIQVMYDDFDTHLEPVARRMYVEPGKLPLVVAADEHLNGLYACCGYNVGVVDLLYRILG